MSRRILGALLIPILLGTPARAQLITAGSTPAGDYLRGVGIAAQGMGQYNLLSAQANQINTQTVMTWNEYVWASTKVQAREYAARKAYEKSKHEEEYSAIQKRYLENPEDLDVMKGNALNAVLEQLNDPRISESSYRSAEVPLPADFIRRIPFKLGEKNETFSLSRLSLKGKAKVPPALQDPHFASYLRAYERVLDNAMEQAIDGKMTIPAIEAVKKSVDDLERRLNDVVLPSSDRLYMEAKGKLDELKKVVELFKTHKVQQALGEIDKYPGTTVGDLRAFMQRHNLQFAPAETPDERTLYPELHAALSLQRDKVSAAFPAQGR
ncbi:MAG: hypothetical protein ACLQGP_24940 [Isosphaeraceae bacterium]